MNACTTFEDLSATDAPRAIKWDFDVSTSPLRCMQIKVGQKVRWTADGANVTADFVTHPLDAQGGDTPNPIADVDEASGEVTFPTAGIFGFACGIHPAMTGAIKVVD